MIGHGKEFNLKRSWSNGWVTPPPDLTKLSHAEKDALILALLAQLAAAHERIAAQDVRIALVEARIDALTHPPKTSDNSSKPPVRGQKRDTPGTHHPLRKSRPASAGHCTRTPTVCPIV